MVDLTDEQYQAMLDRIEVLERRLNTLDSSELGHSLMLARPRIPYLTTFTGATADKRYALRREAGGNVSLVVQPAAGSSWSDA